MSSDIPRIVSLSGGKDSTAMLLMLLEKGCRVDEIVFCDTSAEFHQMYEHLDKLEKYIKIPIAKLNREHDFEYMMFNYKKTKGKNKGHCGYQWSDFRNRWCTKYFKQQPFRRYIREKYGKAEVYIGIAADEPQRVKDDIYPLVEWGIAEQEALKYCYEKGFDWGGLYEIFDRVSCWCCPLQNLKELEKLYLYFPDLWEKLKEWDKRNIEQYGRKFRKDYSVAQLEDKFMKEV